jgi:hypothetical protein
VNQKTSTAYHLAISEKWGNIVIYFLHLPHFFAGFAATFGAVFFIDFFAMSITSFPKSKWHVPLALRVPLRLVPVCKGRNAARKLGKGIESVRIISSVYRESAEQEPDECVRLAAPFGTVREVAVCVKGAVIRLHDRIRRADDKHLAVEHGDACGMDGVAFCKGYRIVPCFAKDRTLTIIRRRDVRRRLA